MRIGVNLIPLRPGQMGGAEVYVRDLLAELRQRDVHDLVLVTADYNHDTLPRDSARCRRVLFVREGGEARRPAVARRAVLRGIWWMQRQYRRHVPATLRTVLRPMMRAIKGPLDAGLARLRGRHQQRRADSLRDLIRRERLDLWFCPFTDLQPRVCPVPAVITVHDVQHEYYPEFFDAQELQHRRRFYPESCAAADHIIAVSDFTRRCVLDKYDADPDAVSTIWEAAGSDFDWRGARARTPVVREKYALPARYVLYPANTWHHKNHARLVEALARYRERYGEMPTLVLTGVGKEGQASLEIRIQSRRLAEQVRILGYVPRDELPTLYAGAACLVFPSLFEGFGLPLVEAMLVGCPIAAAEVTSIPEVVGDAGVLFDPLDPEDICHALAAILRDPARAAELARRGRARAELFSVARMAEQTLALFERAVREGATRRGNGREAIAVEGVYEDRWIGHEAVLILTGRALASVEIEGELAGISTLVPQDLAVHIAGQPARTVSLATPGPFRVSVPLPTVEVSPGAWEVSIVSGRTFCPVEHGLSADSRDLSVQLLRVRARTHDGREIVKTLGAAGDGGQS